jgi:hypothetical protein
MRRKSNLRERQHLAESGRRGIQDEGNARWAGDTQIDNDLATALACSMNNLANGPQARFFSVRMAIA